MGRKPPRPLGVMCMSLITSAIVAPLTLSFSTNALADPDPQVEADYNLKLLGKYVFFDKISEPKRMACVTCHDPDTGGIGSNSGVNLHQVAITGANPHTVGNLKPPSNMHASFVEPFRQNTTPPFIPPYFGGNFWDGRAEGRQGPTVNLTNDADQLFPSGATRHIGAEVFQDTNGHPVSLEATSDYHNYFGPTADQALNPMLNPVEQNVASRQAVCQQLQSAKYAPLYKLAWGVDIDCSSNNASSTDENGDTEKQFDISFKRIILGVCAWQHSADLNSFSSKRDKAIADEIAKYGTATFPLDGLTAQENLGHDLFYGKAACIGCHLDNPGENGTEPQQRYTDSGYHNIGTPPNPEIPGGDLETV
jgi:cytochrome c peroxidase